MTEENVWNAKGWETGWSEFATTLYIFNRKLPHSRQTEQLVILERDPGRQKQNQMALVTVNADVTLEWTEWHPPDSSEYAFVWGWSSIVSKGPFTCSESLLNDRNTWLLTVSNSAKRTEDNQYEKTFYSWAVRGTWVREYGKKYLGMCRN